MKIIMPKIPKINLDFLLNLGNGRWNKVLDLISDTDLKNDLEQTMQKHNSSVTRYINK